MKTPDWSFWQRMQSVKLWQAVLLSMNIDPDEYNDELASFDERFAENVEASKRLRLLDNNRYSINPTGGREFVRLPEFAAWAASVMQWPGLPAELVALAQSLGKVPAASGSGNDDSEPGGKSQPDNVAPVEWQESARKIADELDKVDAKGGAYDSIKHIAERVAVEMRERNIQGPRGPLSDGTIMREALQGGKWKRKR